LKRKALLLLVAVMGFGRHEPIIIVVVVDILVVLIFAELLI